MAEKFELTERGEWLLGQLEKQRGVTSTGAEIVVSGEGDKLIRAAIGTRCPVCKKKIRGAKHASGDHHRGINPHKRKR